MNTPAAFKEVDVKRLIKAADKCGKVVTYKDGQIFIVDKEVYSGDNVLKPIEEQAKGHL